MTLLPAGSQHVLSHNVHLFVTSWTIPHQSPLSTGFCRQEYLSGLPFPSPGDLPVPGIEPVSFASPALAGGIFYTYLALHQWFPTRGDPAPKGHLMMSGNICSRDDWGALGIQRWWAGDAALHPTVPRMASHSADND